MRNPMRALRHVRFGLEAVDRRGSSDERLSMTKAVVAPLKPERQERGLTCRS
jgi:hypothetical protein